MFDSSRPMRVLGISGSLRRRSYNTAALRAAGELMPDDMVLEIADIGDLPLYNQDLEREHGTPESVDRIRAKAAASDALLVATPEYNYSVTGALKNAIDWLSRPPDPPINLMPTAILGAGGRLGTARAQQHFRDIARHNDLKVVQKPEVLISGAWEKFDEELNLVDQRTRDQIERLVLALRGLTQRIQLTRKRVLVLGRHPRTMSAVTSRLREVGYEPVAVLDDESALELIDPGQFSAVIIGGGVEPESRSTVIEHVTRFAPSTAVAEVNGPGSVIETLEAALSARR